eukprot:157351-Amorphochlora_amoeboformis.AAC.2
MTWTAAGQSWAHVPLQGHTYTTLTLSLILSHSRSFSFILAHFRSLTLIDAHSRSLTLILAH